MNRSIIIGGVGHSCIDASNKQFYCKRNEVSEHVGQSLFDFIKPVPNRYFMRS